MDVPTVDLSDSDSGESWTLIEPSALQPDEVLDVSENSHERNQAEHIEKDDDTDGISIISDSDHETTLQFTSNDESSKIEDNNPSSKQIPTYIAISPQIANVHQNTPKSIMANDNFLNDNSVKLKTYVHRRNKRLSTVLNIIMLGSVITAAGVAIGHMWGAKNDCAMQSIPSVNKILSNLYKLQEENAYLRHKLKELTLISNYQLYLQKTPMTQQRCKKVFEEPLGNKNANKITKCLDSSIKKSEESMEGHFIQPLFEKEFLNEINKLRNVYQQNKSWLDEEIARRMKLEKEESLKQVKNNVKLLKVHEIDKHKSEITKNSKPLSLQHIEDQSTITENQPINNDSKITEQETIYTETKITYADSLKTEQKLRNSYKKESDNKIYGTENVKTKMPKNNRKSNIENIASEAEVKKDDRYSCSKCNYNRKINEKWRKKEKRKNKYDKLEMKGFIADFNNILPSVSEESDFFNNGQEKLTTKTHMKRKNNRDSSKVKEIKKTDNINRKPKDEEVNWYEKRAGLRDEARKIFKYEVLGENGLINNSGWYFRRMKRRELCRAKANNATHKRSSSSNMNFKVKH